MKLLRRALLFGAVLLLGFGLGRPYPVVNRPPVLPLQDVAVMGIAAADAPVTFRETAGGFLDITPAEGYGTLFIFYPSGLVPPRPTLGSG